MFVASPTHNLKANGDPEILDAFGVLEWNTAYIDGSCISDYDTSYFIIDGIPTSGYLYYDGTFEISMALQPGYHEIQVADVYGTSEKYSMWIE